LPLDGTKFHSQKYGSIVFILIGKTAPILVTHDDEAVQMIDEVEAELKMSVVVALCCYVDPVNR
jgi:hypothetical protein